MTTIEITDGITKKLILHHWFPTWGK